MLKLFGRELSRGGSRSSSATMGSGGHFRSSLWDPVLIIAQIATMQAAFYFCLGLWVFFLDVIGRFDLSLDQMFTQAVSEPSFIQRREKMCSTSLIKYPSIFFCL
jgi:hypothetical protein